MKKYEFIEEAKKSLDILAQDISRFEAEYYSIKEENKKEYQKKLSELQKNSDNLQTKIKEAQNVADEDWDKVKKAFSESIQLIKTEIKNYLQDIKNKLK